MKNWKRWMGVLGMCLAVTANAASERPEGHFEGNGGDAVLKDGNLVLRDFMQKARIDAVPDTIGYLKGYPELSQLIRDLAPGNPSFAMSIWSNLSETRLWLTDAALPLLPAAATALVAGKADVQIAIRYGNDIVISRPALAQVQDKEYVFLHEALHGLMGDASSAWHHEKVRALVRYVKENRGHYDAKAFDQILGKFQVDAGRPWREEGADIDAQRQVAIAMVQETGSREARCAVYTGDELSLENRVIPVELPQSFPLPGLSSWGDYANCAKTSPEKLMLRRFPSVKNLWDTISEASWGYVSEVRVPANLSYFSSRYSYYLKSCKEEANPSVRPEMLAKEEAAYRKLLSIQKQLKGGLNQEKDIATAYLIHTYLAELKSGIEKSEEALKEPREDFRKSIQNCRAAFGDYMKK
jgi:hypothetical protein